MEEAHAVSKDRIGGNSLVDSGDIRERIPCLVVPPHGMSEEGFSKLSGTLQSLGDDLNRAPSKESLESLGINCAVMGSLPGSDHQVDC